MPASTPTPAHHPDVAAIRAEAVRAEHARQADIKTRFAPMARREGVAELQAACLADPSIDDDEACRRLLAHLGRQATPTACLLPASAYGYGDADFKEAASDALMIRAGLRVEKPHPEAREMRHMSVATIAETLLSRTGHAPLSRAPKDIIKAALSTSDFPGLLANVANKALRQGYTETPITFGDWTAEREVPDFKPTTLAMLSEAPDLQEVAELGEYKFGALSDSATTFKIATFGRILRISRQALINDDLGALTDIPNMLGVSARRLEADKVYALLNGNPVMTDGVALFHASHGNLAAAGTALNISTLSMARVAMRSQKGLSGGSTFIDPQPRFLIVPVALEDLAEGILSSISNQAKGTTFGPAWMSQLTVISDPRLDAASTTAWYLAAAPEQMEGVTRAYLAGELRPYLEEFDEKTVDANSYKARLDFGVGVIDFRGLYKNPGA